MSFHVDILHKPFLLDEPEITPIPDEAEETTEDEEDKKKSGNPVEGFWAPDSIVYYGPRTRAVSLTGEINDETAVSTVSQLLALSTMRRDAPIKLHLNTPGGDLMAAMAIYDAITTMETPVIAVAMGRCASAGLIILSACDYRTSLPSTCFFYHQLILPSLSITAAEEITSNSDAYIYMQDNFDEILRKRCGMRKRDYVRIFKGKRAKYIFAPEALEIGLIDHVFDTYRKKVIATEA